MAPAFYDPTSPNEQPVPLPSAPSICLSENSILQAPLTRRGTGPGLVLILPPLSSLELSIGSKPLDPEPIMKWAEEGFAVVGITSMTDSYNCDQAIQAGINALRALPEVDEKEKFGLIVYDQKVLPISHNPSIACQILYLDDTANVPPLDIPTIMQVPSTPFAAIPNATIHVYPSTQTPFFILPQTRNYDPPSASLAHTRSLVFLRKHLGGPFFDLESIWEEHTYFEFVERSVAKTMGTMVAEPYVNHVPTMTGGMGREKLTAFYRDHFIFANPADVALNPISRTIGPDRIIDEFIYTITHDKVVPWFLPGIPPSGRKLEVPVMAVVCVRGDRLYNEHIWWDQATALFQAGVLPAHIDYPGGSSGRKLRLPIAGAETAAMLKDERSGRSNMMLESTWEVN